MTKSPTLRRRLLVLENSPPSAWRETGVRTRPNLHGLLRYLAMMVPCMQGDIIDVILAHRPGHCRVLDPFVGSGTVMTEALVRGLNFTSFVTAKPERDTGQGLGLFIVTELLRADGCDISLLADRNEDGRRYRFAVNLRPLIRT